MQKENTLFPLPEEIVLSCKVEVDEYIDYIKKVYDYGGDGETTFALPSFSVPDKFSLGLIVGASGSGKTQILRHYFDYTEKEYSWDNHISILSHFSSPEEGVTKLMSCGLSSIPVYTKPYRTLSNGERFRADVARRIGDNAIIDEFTSVVDREVAKSLSISISSYIRRTEMQGVVLASCHKDIIEWLEPDWVFDTDKTEMDYSLIKKTRKRKAKIEIEY